MGVDAEAFVVDVGPRDGDDVKIRGQARVSGEYTENIEWEATVAFTALSTVKKAAVRAAIVAAAAASPHNQTIGALNKVTLWAEPAGL